MTEPLLTGYYQGGLKTGYSLRESLTSQGVTCMTAMRQHLTRAKQLLDIGLLDSVMHYKVDTNHPNSLNHPKAV